MEGKKLNKKSLYAIIAVVFLGVIGVTFAYYQTNNTLTNEFNAGKYKIKTEEVFVSPDNWQPGDVTEKKVNVTNEGTIDAAVKVCLRQKWEDANGNPLPLTDSNNNRSVYLNFSMLADAYWLGDCSNNNEDKYCFYYYKRLEPNEVTEDLLQSVRFNEWFNNNSTTTCTEDSTTHTKSCTSSVNGYAGGKYTLYVDIETVQYNSYQDAWGNVSIIKGYDESYQPICENLNIMRSLPNTNGKVSYIFSANKTKLYLKDNELNNYDMSRAYCRTIYVNSVSEENRYNECSNVIYHDELSHNEGETLNIQTFNLRTIDYSSTEIDNITGATILLNAEISTEETDSLFYNKNTIIHNYYHFNDDDNVTMSINSIIDDDWNSEGLIKIHLGPSTSFKMPNHGVIFEIGFHVNVL